MTRIVNIDNSFESYQKLINLYEENKDKSFNIIDIELHTWFSANMCATFGAILDLLSKKFNSFIFNIPKNIETILLKNDFLTYYGRVRAIDTYGTTIRFLKMTSNDAKYFKTYVIKELIGRTELPCMSEAVKDKIVEAIYEMFVNAQIHSESENIYTCGQSFPNKHTLEFTIVDTGIGIKNRVNTFLNSSLSASQAIQWAIIDKNTTKWEITGGIGLALLKEFIEKNTGKMQIISDSGFYEFGNEGEVIKEFNGKFPGTIVNLQFNTNDKSNYYLQSEIDINEIF